MHSGRGGDGEAVDFAPEDLVMLTIGHCALDQFLRRQRQTPISKVKTQAPLVPYQPVFTVKA